jgi:hypothetical protein
MTHRLATILSADVSFLEVYPRAIESRLNVAFWHEPELQAIPAVRSLSGVNRTWC